MLTNYLEMIRLLAGRAVFSDRVYTYGNLADLALEKQKQFHLENGKPQLVVIRRSLILEQLTSFSGLSGNRAVPLIVPGDVHPDTF